MGVLFAVLFAVFKAVVCLLVTLLFHGSVPKGVSLTAFDLF
jgi:hypothetical protein